MKTVRTNSLRKPFCLFSACFAEENRGTVCTNSSNIVCANSVNCNDLIVDLESAKISFTLLMTKTKTMVLVLVSIPLFLPVSKEKGVLVSGESVFFLVSVLA